MSTLTVNKFVSLRRSLEKSCKFDNKETNLHLELHSRTVTDMKWSRRQENQCFADGERLLFTFPGLFVI